MRGRLLQHETVTLLLLGFILCVCLAASLLGGAPLRSAGLIGAIGLAYLALSKLSSRLPSHPDAQRTVSAFATVGVMFALYLALSRVPFEVMPYTGDRLLANLDRLLGLGTAPVLWTQRFATDPVVRLCSLAYALFIPYLYLSIFLSLLGRPAPERRQFITGFAVLYALSFLGYLLLPARGPVVLYANDFTVPLHGGAFHRLVLESIERCGGPHGAFPSLHLGASAYACLFDLRYNRVRGLLYLPLVLAIAVATVILRYHYVVDLLAGLAFALLALGAARRVDAPAPSTNG